MATIKNLTGRQSSTTNDYTKNWQGTLWREWRNCNDKAYADHLFELVIDEPVDRWGMVVFVLFIALLVGLGGWLLVQLLYPQTVTTNWGMWAMAGVVTGGILGFLVMWLLKLTSHAIWRFWLPGLIPNTLTGTAKADGWNSPLLGLAVVLSSGMGVGITGALFFGQSNAQFYLLLILLVIVIGVGYYLNRTPGLIRGVVTATIGMLLGLFFGLGFAQLVGMFITPLDVDNSARVVGVAVGVTVGILFGRRAGLMGILLCQVILIALMVQTLPLDVVLLGCLVGTLGGGLVGSLSRIFLPARQLSSDDVYGYRQACLWWWQRPYFTEVETALQAINDKPAWLKKITNRSKAASQPDSVQETLLQLENADWAKRFLARQIIVSLGGEAIPSLQAIDKTNPIRKEAVWLIGSIGYETTTRLAREATHFICTNCLACCRSHAAIYYGCRTCGQSRDFYYCPQGVTAVLDNGQVEPHMQNDTLRVNWLERRELFDFDRVEIIQATDEDVERFVVQIGNDTDTVRSSRYAKMLCYVAPECQLSQNTVRILEKTFAGMEGNTL